MDPSKYGVRPSKSLGQNFILDEGIQAELADFTGITKEDVNLASTAWNELKKTST